jgi:hypothetical protein
MYGTIIFKTTEELAMFLAWFGRTNSTCTFKCEEIRGNYHITFNGGK